MGLDMNLSEKVYIGAEFDHRKITGTIDIAQDGKPFDIPLNEVEYITLSKGYWRKANQIHKWFVDCCQDGVDDCRATYVSYEQLKELRSLCCEIMEAKGETQKRLIEETLPPESGFFFGNAEVDSNEGLEYYLQDIDETITIIDKLNPNGDYQYQSSW